MLGLRAERTFHLWALCMVLCPPSDQCVWMGNQTLCSRGHKVLGLESGQAGGRCGHRSRAQSSHGPRMPSSTPGATDGQGLYRGRNTWGATASTSHVRKRRLRAVEFRSTPPPHPERRETTEETFTRPSSFPREEMGIRIWGEGGWCVHLDFDSPPSQPRCRPLQQWPSKPGRGGSKQGGGQGQEAWDVGAGNRAEPSNLPGSLPFPQRS